MVAVDQVQRRMALGLLVGDALDDPVRVEPVLAQGLPLRVSEVRFVDGEDYATHCHGGRSAMEASPKEREREREREM